MLPSRPIAHLSYAEYLALEATADQKHEFLRGDVFAMAGGTIAHGALSMAIGAALVEGLRGRPCRVFSSDVRVRIEETDYSTYPDVTVVCGSLVTAERDPHAIVNPIVVVEVLSDGTEAHDRGAKAAHYRRIPALQEYVLVSQHEPHIEVYRKNAEGRWELFEFRAGERATFASVGVDLAVDALYADPLAP